MRPWTGSVLAGLGWIQMALALRRELAEGLFGVSLLIFEPATLYRRCLFFTMMAEVLKGEYG